MGAKQQAFIEKLHELFQINNGLDFGIYRIINEKKSDIENYINNTLPNKINEFLKNMQTVSVDNTAKIKELETKIKNYEELGKSEEVLKKIDEVRNQISQLQQASLSGNTEEEMYDKLLTFFSRYYDEGDFISQRRYKDGVYAVPYSGEEVKLHWANHDQYYIKTGENFKDYTFNIEDDFNVTFILTDAEIERDNNKSDDKKVYVLAEASEEYEKPIYVLENEEKTRAELFIRLSYRYGKDVKQKESSEAIINAVKQLENNNEISSHINSKIGNLFKIRNEQDKDKDIYTKSHIGYHLNKYIAKNSFDFFIHKDLKKFLMQELDFYIKNEVIYLQDLYGSKDNIKNLDMYVKKASVIQNIGSEIITFLAQLEDFQKELYLKKKFVTETNYCITLDKINEKYYDEIIANQAQIEEWKKLFAIDEIELSTLTPAYSEPLTKEFLKANEYLVLDTAFFSEEFKEKIIADIENLDENIDGLLIHGDNFQALNLMQEKYKEQVQCVYIDPPYNTKASEIIYKNGYKDSSWLSLIYTRMELLNKLLINSSIITVAIDHAELYNLGKLLDYIYSYDNRIAVVTVQHNPKGRNQAEFFSENTEYLLFYSNNKKYAVFNDVAIDDDVKETFIEQDNVGKYRWEPYIRARSSWSKINRPDNWYPIYVSKDLTVITTEFRDDYYEIYPETNNGQFSWKNIKDTFNLLNIDNYFKAVKEDNTIKIYHKYRENQVLKNLWIDKKYQSEFNGTNLLKNLFSGNDIFSYPKSLYAVIDVIKLSSFKNSYILDFFAGSGTTGHAVINLNREDNGKRKYILVEMGEYFDTVTKPRIEKVIYSKDWKDGKPVSREGSSHIFKYIRLESYEDTLNNVEFSKPLVIDDFLENEYLIKYKISKEAEGSKIYLPVEAIYNPFEFYLKITRKNESREQKIDLIETFNFLTGLQVNNIYTKKYNAEFKTTDTGRLEAKIKLDDNGAYIFKIVEGVTLKGEKVLVIWRNIVGDINNNDDINQNNAVLESVTLKNQIKPADSEYDIIYINCTNSLQNFAKEGSYKVALIEEVMKDKMFNGI